MSEQIKLFILKGDSFFNEFNFELAKTSYIKVLTLANQIRNQNPSQNPSQNPIRNPAKNPSPEIHSIFIEINRKIGLANLHLQKWETSETDKLNLFEGSIDFFKNSLAWSRKRGENHLENVQVILLLLNLFDLS